MYLMFQIKEYSDIDTNMEAYEVLVDKFIEIDTKSNLEIAEKKLFYWEMCPK